MANSKLQAALKQIQENPSAGPALMTHVVLGYPTLEESISFVKVMAENGAAIIELQIPFSDPMADGPTIMEANQVALDQGVTPADCFQAMKTLASDVPTPLLFMTYFNLLLNSPNGTSGFLDDAKAAGASGLIVPDIPPEETQEGYWEKAPAAELAAIPIVSPVTDNARMEMIKSATVDGFVYCVSVTGTTGARTELPPDLAEYLSRVKKVFQRPVALGFGISSREQVQQLSGHADIAVVGSAMINIIRETAPAERESAVRDFVRQLSSG